MANPWFRMYHEFATDPKVQMLSEVDQRRFIMLLCLRCCNDGETLHDEEIAFQLRVSNEEFAKTKQLLIDKGLINEDCSPTAWDKRQFASDSSTARVKAYRERNKRDKKQDGNVSVTAPDTDTDTDTELKESSAKASPPAVVESKKKNKRGTRLPDDWKLTEEYLAAAHELRPELISVIETVAGNFADYWHAKAGQGATKIDWLATWRNWLRNEKTTIGGNSYAASNRPNPPRENDLRRIERESREIFAQCEAEEASERAMGPNGPAVWQQVGQPGGGNFN